MRHRPRDGDIIAEVPVPVPFTSVLSPSSTSFKPFPTDGCYHWFWFAPISGPSSSVFSSGQQRVGLHCSPLADRANKDLIIRKTLYYLSQNAQPQGHQEVLRPRWRRAEAELRGVGLSSFHPPEEALLLTPYKEVLLGQSPVARPTQLDLVRLLLRRPSGRPLHRTVLPCCRRDPPLLELSEPVQAVRRYVCLIYFAFAP